jgi:hypothetical protein
MKNPSYADLFNAACHDHNGKTAPASRISAY